MDRCFHSCIIPENGWAQEPHTCRGKFAFTPKDASRQGPAPPSAEISGKHIFFEHYNIIVKELLRWQPLKAERSLPMDAFHDAAGAAAPGKNRIPYSARSFYLP
jgi:hypothetical protein